jgi:hypothetical protein
MVKCGVFFAVRTEFLNIIYTCFGFKGLMIAIVYPLAKEFEQLKAQLNRLNKE